MCANLARCCSASSGIRMVAAICELSDNTKSYNWQTLWMGTYMEMGACLRAIQNKSWFISLTIDDAFWRHQFSTACYQLAQSIFKIGSALTERVGQGEVGGCTPLCSLYTRQLQS